MRDAFGYLVVCCFLLVSGCATMDQDAFRSLGAGFRAAGYMVTGQPGQVCTYSRMLNGDVVMTCR